MSDLKKLDNIRIELSYINDHLDDLVSRIKSFDSKWHESTCDTSIVFGLLGHKACVDEKLHELKLKIIELEKGE